MTEIHLLNGDKSGVVRVGATRGQSDIKSLVSDLRGSRGEADVLLDFAGIRAVTASYVRASVASLIRSGTLSRSSSAEANKNGLKPLPISQIVVRNLQHDVREEIDGLLRQPSFKLCCFESVTADRWAVIGHLDSALWDCLEALYRCGGEASAFELQKHDRRKAVQITAWNNRLAALYVRMLVDRRKVGRVWVYRTLSKKIEPYGIQIPT